MNAVRTLLDFEAPTTPSGIVARPGGGLLVALRVEGADARADGGTELLTVIDGAVAERKRLPEIAEVHGMSLGKHGLWITDRAAHVVRAYDWDGELISTLGRPDEPSDSGCTVKGGDVLTPAGPFNLPTQTVEYGNEVFVSDGYGNARIHVFGLDGALRRSFGSYGSGVGELRLPHSLVVTSDGRVLVCDRENSRIQAFDVEGRCIGVWWTTHRPTDIVCVGTSVYVSDLSPQVTCLDLDGRILDQWTVDRSAHNLAVTSEGIYVTHLRLNRISRIEVQSPA